MKVSQYCRSPSVAMNCAHSSAVHSVMIERGKVWSSTELPNVVGVCSLEGGSESVGEFSESVCSWVGDVMTLRSYSSSASESAW
jgi:hypothetical protein